jgi:hypothetical protein
MAIKTSTILGNGRDDDRISGFIKVAAGWGGASYFNGGIDAIIGGTVVCSDASDVTGKSLRPFQGAVAISNANPMPFGLVFENTKPYASVASGDQAAGRGFDSLDYARGGEYSIFHRPGNFVDLYDDGRDTTQITPDVSSGTPQNFSCPFVAADNFAVGDLVYATGAATVGKVAGRLTRVNTAATVVIGWVRAINGLSGNQQIFTLELNIRTNP